MLLSRFRSGSRGLRERLRLPRKYRNHMDAASIKELVGNDVWESYFKFSIERNPWDKIVSQFYWDQKGTKKGLSFREYVLGGQGLKSDFDRYTINGILAVDRLLRYDQLYKDIDQIGAELGLPGSCTEVLQSLSAKSGFRRTKEVSSHYDEETRRAVAVYCARENELLGFTFKECP